MLVGRCVCGCTALYLVVNYIVFPIISAKSQIETKAPEIFVQIKCFHLHIYCSEKLKQTVFEMLKIFTYPIYISIWNCKVNVENNKSAIEIR